MPGLHLTRPVADAEWSSDADPDPAGHGDGKFLRSGRFGPCPFKLPNKPSVSPCYRWRETTGRRVVPGALAPRAKSLSDQTGGPAPGFYERRTTTAGLTMVSARRGRPGRLAVAIRADAS